MPAVTREKIVEIARTYIGTPFARKGRVRGKGLDCVGLPLMIAEELGLVDKSGKPLNGGSFSTYSDQPTGTYVHDVCLEHLVYKPVREMEPGDIVTVNVVTAPCHVAVVGSDSKGRATLIHAYNGGPKLVIEHPIDAKWQRRIVGCFKFPEVID